ncbi:hypothetical protein AYK24_09120 [Thermoplasmatales archaeon SG8-52-4]|nr:MAG: hypothetical protein AYK24_09120 [Thermoplasmatales archaeon SG8-52-4]
MRIKIIAVILCIIFLISTLPVTGNTIKNEKTTIYSLGTLRDLNLDLAVTNAISNQVNIYIGDGAGGFTNTGGIPVGTFPAGITDGDFNSDGILDLITTNYEESNVTVLLGDGSGGFTVSGNFSVGLEPLGIKDGDFNSDGNLDLAVANTGSNKVSVLLGDGLGGFGTDQKITAGTGPVDVCIAKFDGDDNFDIISANYDSNSIGLLTGDGIGGFVLSNTISLGTDYKPYAITNADFDEDGNMDVAFASCGFPYVGVLYGNGSGEFSNLVNFTVGHGLERFDIVAEDFDNDGNLDIAVPNTDNDTISVLIGDGLGGFGPHQTFSVGGYPVGICKGDFDSDGNYDLVVTNAFDNTISILLGDGTGGFEDQLVKQTGEVPVGIIAGNIDYIPIADLDCDGTIRWTRMPPGTDIIDEFQVGNTGEANSVLHWQIDSYPSWGEFNFSEESGYIKDGVWEAIQVFITAPIYQNTDYTGTIKIINVDNPSDYCEIDVTIETPRTNSLIQTLLNRLLERFPNLFTILRGLIEI